MFWLDYQLFMKKCSLLSIKGKNNKDVFCKLLLLYALFMG